MDVQIRFGATPAGVSEAFANEIGGRRNQNTGENGRPEAVSWHPNGGDGFRLRYDDGTIFVVDERGSRIWATWPKTLTLEDTAVYLLGPVLALVLRLRGISCLHASAFSADGRAVALVGPSGAGKSTIAAAFAGRGFAVLSDDTLAIEEQHDNFIAQPGYPRLRLWPDAVRVLYGGRAALPRLTPNWDKRYLDLHSNGCRFERQPLSLSAIYLLDERRDDSTAPFVESLTASAGLLSLLANARGDFHRDKQSHSREFDTLGRIVQRVPIRRVVARTGTRSLARLCDVILDDLQSVSEHAINERKLTCTI
ncbi:MAG: serine/threonine protein kinase [Planctomycetota bacterium]